MSDRKVQELRRAAALGDSLAKERLKEELLRNGQAWEALKTLNDVGWIDDQAINLMQLRRRPGLMHEAIIDNVLQRDHGLLCVMPEKEFRVHDAGVVVQNLNYDWELIVAYARRPVPRVG